MKNPLQVGSLGHYGATLGAENQARVEKMNKLVDEWNEKIPQFESVLEQQAFIDDWHRRMDEIKNS